MKIQFLEIVTPDVESTMSIFAASTGAKFSEPVAEFGNARILDMPDGGNISVRAPMSETEVPTTRTYFLTDDIDTATKRAVAAGAELAHPVLEIAGRGKFSIFFHGSHQFGFWEK